MYGRSESYLSSLFYDSKQDKIVGLREINDEQRPYAAGYAFTIMLQGIISNWNQLVLLSFPPEKSKNSYVVGLST